MDPRHIDASSEAHTPVVYKAGLQSKEDPFEFVMSTADEDRVGDTINQDGWDLADFRKNPIALWSHAHSLPIGTWSKVRVEGGQLRGVLNLAEPGTSPLIDTTRKLLEQRILKAVSVGFMPLDYAERRGPRDEFLGIEFRKQALLECSPCAVPMNPHALAVARECGLGALEVRSLFDRADSARLTAAQVKEFVLTPASAQLLRGMPRADALARAAAAVKKATGILKGVPS